MLVVLMYMLCMVLKSRDYFPTLHC